MKTLKMRDLIRSIGLLVMLHMTTPIQAQVDAYAYALTNVNIFDGEQNRIHENRIVFVRGGKIERMTVSDTVIPVGYQVIDGEQNYLMPGLIDVHTHIISLAQARRALDTGVPTVRTAGVAAYQDVSLRELARAGVVAGPDVVAAGVFVTPNLADAVQADPRL